MMYLVKGKVHTRPYMGDTKKNKEWRLVDAVSTYEAERKFREHFEADSEEYGTSITVMDVTATSMIT